MSEIRCDCPGVYVEDLVMTPRHYAGCPFFRPAANERKFTGGGTRNCIPEPDPRDAEIARLRGALERIVAIHKERRSVVGSGAFVEVETAALRALEPAGCDRP